MRHEEAARQLGCPVGTVESRLSRARDQLRTRLERRGLAPTPAVLAAIFRPPSGSPLGPRLVEATIQKAFHLSSIGPTIGTGMGSAPVWLAHTSSMIPRLHAMTVASTLAIVAGVTVLGLAAYRDGEPAGLDARSAAAATVNGTLAARPVQKSLSPSSRPDESLAPEERRRGKAQYEPESGRANRHPSALAFPLSQITIDGRLDDWPPDSERYPITNQLLHDARYNASPGAVASDQIAYYMAGYDPDTQQIYLAVVVHDEHVVVHPTDVLQTDAVEIYIEGTPSTKTKIQQPSGDWRETFDAATMPVLQYVGVPGEVSAYGDPWNANPSLVYARTRQSATKIGLSARR